MGATNFEDITDGQDMQTAFATAREQALWEHGHGGYTGSIAEKSSVVLIQAEPTSVEQARELGLQLIDARDPRIDDKRGPAGAIRIESDELPEGQQRWYFFGWASD